MVFLVLATFAMGIFVNKRSQPYHEAYTTQVALENLFTHTSITQCFLDDQLLFDVSSFTNETLQQCTSSPMRLTFQNINQAGHIIIGRKDLEPDVSLREYVNLPTGGGVLTIELEHL